MSSSSEREGNKAIRKANQEYGQQTEVQKQVKVFVSRTKGYKKADRERRKKGELPQAPPILRRDPVNKVLINFDGQAEQKFKQRKCLKEQGKVEEAVNLKIGFCEVKINEDGNFSDRIYPDGTFHQGSDVYSSDLFPHEDDPETKLKKHLGF